MLFIRDHFSITHDIITIVIITPVIFARAHAHAHTHAHAREQKIPQS